MSEQNPYLCHLTRLDLVKGCPNGKQLPLLYIHNLHNIFNSF